MLCDRQSDDNGNDVEKNNNNKYKNDSKEEDNDGEPHIGIHSDDMLCDSQDEGNDNINNISDGDVVADSMTFHSPENKGGSTTTTKTLLKEINNKAEKKKNNNNKDRNVEEEEESNNEGKQQPPDSIMMRELLLSSKNDKTEEDKFFDAVDSTLPDSQDYMSHEEEEEEVADDESSNSSDSHNCGIPNEPSTIRTVFVGRQVEKILAASKQRQGGRSSASSHRGRQLLPGLDDHDGPYVNHRRRDDDGDGVPPKTPTEAQLSQIQKRADIRNVESNNNNKKRTNDDDSLRRRRQQQQDDDDDPSSKSPRAQRDYRARFSKH